MFLFLKRLGLFIYVRPLWHVLAQIFDVGENNEDVQQSVNPRLMHNTLTWPKLKREKQYLYDQH